MRLKTLLGFVFSVTVSFANAEFVGVLAGPTLTLFAVRESPTQPTRWVSVGEPFGAFVVKAYDAGTESLTVQKGDENLVLKLPQSRVKDGGKIRLAGNPSVMSSLDLAYALARSGDEVVSEMVLTLERQVASRVGVAKELENAKNAFAIGKKDIDAVRVSQLSRRVRTETEMEANLRRRVIEVADSRKPPVN